MGRGKRAGRYPGGRQERPTAQPTVALPLADRMRPWLLAALVALLVARPLFPSEASPEAGDNLTSIMLWLALAVVWLLGVIRVKEFRLRFGAVDVAVLVLVGWHTVAGLWTISHGSPRAAIDATWLWIAYGVSFFLARQLVASRREARATIVVMIGLAVGLAAYGIEQYFYELPTTRANYAKDPDAALQAAGIWYPEGSPERVAFELRLAALEPYASFAMTNSLAGFLAPWLTITVGIAICGWRSRHRRWLTLTAVGFAVVLGTCLLLTKSRSACVAVLAGFPLAWWACRQRTWRLNWKPIAAIVAGIAVLVVLVTVVGGLDKQVASEATKSLGYRIEYWRSTLSMVADHPWVGCGPGQFQQSYTAYKLPESSEEIADPHNFLLETAAEAGVPALVALIAVLGLFAWAMLIGHRPSSPPPDTHGAGPAATDDKHAAPAIDGLPEVAASDASAFVLGGGVAGFLLAFALGIISSAPVGIASLMIGLPLAVLVTACWWPWLWDGVMPALLPAVGLIVLLINLLAAGALSFAGLAGSLWLLMALGLNLAGPAEGRRMGPWTRYVVIGAAVIACLLCYVTAYKPVLKRQTAIRQATESPNWGIEYLEAAVAADPNAVEPRSQLAAATFALWHERPTPQSLKQFLECQQAVLPLAPHASVMWADAGRRYFEIFHQTRDKDILKRAVEAYRQAVARYPASAERRAELALALQAAGDHAEARREAQRAVELHDLTPHADKKLPPDVLNELNRGPLRSTSGPS